MITQSLKTNWPKFIIGWVVCFAIRLLPFRPPSVEPILTTTMPFAKRWGKGAGFMFGFLSIVLYDLIQGKVGMWTWITAAVYGIVGLGAAWYLKSRSSAWHFAVYAVIGTLVFDALTGLTIGPLFFHQSFIQSVLGQIPFTYVHLLSNVVLALTVSPVLDRWVVRNKRLETTSWQALPRSVQ